MVGSLFLTSVATASEVVSTNIVGYTTVKGKADGFTVVTPTFINVQSVIPAISLDKVGGSLTPWVDNISFLFPDGVYSDPITWYDLDPSFSIPPGPPGWYDGMNKYIGSTNLPAGTALIIFTAEDSDIITFGQVDTNPTFVEFGDGDSFYLFGNSSPVEIYLENLDFDNLTPWVDNVSIMNSDGVLSAPITWYDLDPSFSIPPGPPGWYDDDNIYVGNTQKLKPGEGLVLFTAESGVTVTIPAPIIN